MEGVNHAEKERAWRICSPEEGLTRHGGEVVARKRGGEKGRRCTRMMGEGRQPRERAIGLVAIDVGGGSSVRRREGLRVGDGGPAVHDDKEEKKMEADPNW